MTLLLQCDNCKKLIPVSIESRNEEGARECNQTICSHFANIEAREEIAQLTVHIDFYWRTEAHLCGKCAHDFPVRSDSEITELLFKGEQPK